MSSLDQTNAYSWLLYVDDLVCLTTDPTLKVVLFSAIKASFEFEDKGDLSYFLGMKVTRDMSKRVTTLDMVAYIKEKLKLFKINDKKTVSTAYPSHDTDIGEPLNEEDASLFRSMLGAAIWVVNIRPDLCYSVSRLSSHMSKPHKLHLDTIYRVWRYLNTTINDKLTYSLAGQDLESLMGVGYLHSFESSCVTTGYVDANLEIPKSTTGYMFKMAGGNVISKCKKQPVVSVATYDSEYYAMSSCILCAMWLHMWLTEANKFFSTAYGVHLINGPIVVNGDNSAVIRMVNEKAISTRSRHIQLRWHKMMEAIQEKIAEAHGIMGKFNPADMFTKALNGPDTTKWRLDLLGIKLVDKVQGLKLPSQVEWKPFITNYQAIIKDFIGNYDGFYTGLYGDDN